MWFFRSKNKKEKPLIEELPKPKRKLQYKDEVKIVDGFYEGISGTIVEWEIRDTRKVTNYSTLGSYYTNQNVHWYKVHLDDGSNREVWIEKPCLILSEG